MIVTVRNNDNTLTPYIFEPNGIKRTAEIISFYRNAYSTLAIQGFQVEDALGNIIANGGTVKVGQVA
jgi:hypothetical protein